MYDVIIIGSSVAGLTAGLYTGRKGLKTIIAGEKIGGQIMYASTIENFPAFTGSGYDLIMSLRKQAEAAGAELLDGRVDKIEKLESGFRLQLSKGAVLEARSIIVASGKIPRKLGVPGEERFLGRGVHVCATCDAPLYRDKTVAVIGGGNSAVDAAINLGALARKVYLINTNERCSAEDPMIKKLKSLVNVEIIPWGTIRETKGEKFVSSVVVEDLKSHAQREIAVDGVFVEIGYAVDSKLFEGLVKLNEKREIIVDEKERTSCPGVFAAGDVSSSVFKQAIIAAGAGAKAALSAYEYLSNSASQADWGH
jgi:alkyl hydroperoxide reductase subunit F